MFRSADEEMDGEERLAQLTEKAERRDKGRKLYGGEAKPRARNERYLYGNKAIKEDRDPYDERLTEDTRRKLYGNRH